MARYTMEMVLEWAKVFPENADMGDPDGVQWKQNIAKKGGQYVVNAFFTDQAQIDKLIDEGLQEKVLGNDRILEGNPEFGIGKYIKLKRGVPDDIRDWIDPVTKDKANLGGPVKVVDLRDGREKVRSWSFENDGELGNGTKAMVQFDTYSNGNGIRLNGIAVTELSVWEGGPSEHDELFMVA